MLDRRLLVPVLAFIAAAAAPAAPALSPTGTPQDAQVEVLGSDGLAKSIARLLATQGGQERVEALVGFEFSFVDVVIEPPTEEGGEAVERPSDQVRVSLGVDPTNRRVRLAQAVDLGQGPQELVRVATGAGSRVTVDGEERASEQLAAEARAVSIELLFVLDLMWGLLNGQVIAEADDPRTRDGVRYDCVELRFPEGRGMADVFRLYLDRESGLVRRADQFSAGDLRRKATLLFEEYEVVDGISMPMRIVFLDRDRQAVRRWDLGNPQVDPEWPDDHFAVE